MARISRKCYESCFYHIMVQGINKEYIFKKNENKEKYLSLLNKISLKKEIKIIAYCIMGNHAHILVYTTEINNLSKFMASVNTSYAKYYNCVMNRCGYVYRDRYRCENIMTQNHLDNCIRYIHNNPVEANICDSPSDYIYSSYNLYNNKKIKDDIIELISWNSENYNKKLNGKIEDYNYIGNENEFGEKHYENINDVFNEYIGYDFSNHNNVYKVAMELKKRCHTMNIDIIKLLGVKKTTFYKVLKEHEK